MWSSTSASPVPLKGVGWKSFTFIGPWRIICLEQLAVPELFKTFTVFYGIGRLFCVHDFVYIMLAYLTFFHLLRLYIDSQMIE